jgi:internalin A
VRKTLSLLLLALLLCSTVTAQDSQTAYEIALEMIREAEASGARELDLSDLELETVPPEIGALINLEALYLYGNLLSSLPPEIAHLVNLKELNLDVNEFHSLPPEIGQLTNLLTLSASYNQMTALPPEIGKLQNLDALWLDNNQLESLPAQIGHLSNLYALKLANNQLETLPSEFAHLDNLCVLDLSSNQFRYLPTILVELQTMNEGLMCGMSLEGNLLLSPPPDVLAGGTPAILNYLRNEWWWNLLKLIMSGVLALGLVTLSVLALRWRNGRGK